MLVLACGLFLYVILGASFTGFSIFLKEALQTLYEAHTKSFRGVLGSTGFKYVYYIT
jgi:hypothetical protein